MVAVVHSCVSILEKNWIIRHRNSHVTRLQVTDGSVAASTLFSMAGSGHFQETSAPMPFIYGLNANGFGFTTWNIGRMARVDAMAQRMKLVAVRFKKNVKSTFLGHHVDHIYYRELETIHKIVYKVTTSDHNPLAVVFKVTEQSKGQDS